jgi:hypothetical protein
MNPGNNEWSKIKKGIEAIFHTLLIKNLSGHFNNIIFCDEENSPA